jgi:hypothetical protein
MLGLAGQAYWLIVLSHRPPEAFKDPESRLGFIIVFGGLVAVGGWMILGGLLGVLVGAVRPDENDGPLIPSLAYLLIFLFLSVFGLIIGLTLLRTWKRHVFVTFVLFVGLLGLLLPNLVVAVQN